MSRELTEWEKDLVEQVRRGEIDAVIKTNAYSQSAYAVEILGGEHNHREFSAFGALWDALQEAMKDPNSMCSKRKRESQELYDSNMRHIEKERQLAALQKANYTGKSGLFRKCHYDGESRWDAGYTDDEGNTVYTSFDLYRCPHCGHEFCNMHWRTHEHNCPSA